MHQPSHIPLSQSQSHSQSSRNRDTSSSSHTQPNIRSSLSSLNPSASASAAQVSVPHSTKCSSHQRPQPPQSPPFSITALKEGQDDHDHEHDPDPMLVGEEGQEFLFDLVHVMCAFVADLDLDLLLLLLDHQITL